MLFILQVRGGEAWEERRRANVLFILQVRGGEAWEEQRRANVLFILQVRGGEGGPSRSEYSFVAAANLGERVSYSAILRRMWRCSLIAVQAV